VHPDGGGPSTAISEVALVAQQRLPPLRAACTATRLWGALALREITLRDLQPAVANQRFGNGVKDFLEQQTVRRRICWRAEGKAGVRAFASQHFQTNEIIIGLDLI
jgi:hypothetical protein